MKVTESTGFAQAAAEVEQTMATLATTAVEDARRIVSQLGAEAVQLAAQRAEAMLAAYGKALSADV